MSEENNMVFGNDSFTFFGPMDMAFHEDGIVLDDPDSVKLVVSVLMGIAMVLSIVGNVCTCAVIARDRSMRTPTNCYLFNLAITDVLTILFVPIEIYMIWLPDFYPLGEEGCRIHYMLFSCLCNCSVLTISAFTVERYMVVMKPFLRQTLSCNSRVLKIILAIWVIAISFCIPDMFYIDFLEKKKYVYCYVTLSYTMRIFVGLNLFVFFVVPMTIIFVLYVLIAFKLKSAQPKLRNSPVTGNQGRDKAVKMLAAVAALFFFCWSPYCVLRIMMIFPKYKYEDYYNVWMKLNYICAINGYMSTAVNPILYNLMSHKFRHAFKQPNVGKMPKEVMRFRGDTELLQHTTKTIEPIQALLNDILP